MYGGGGDPSDHKRGIHCGFDLIFGQPLNENLKNKKSKLNTFAEHSFKKIKNSIMSNIGRFVSLSVMKNIFYLVNRDCVHNKILTCLNPFL